MKVPATRVVYDEKVKTETLKRWKKILDTGRVILGADTEEFEKRMAEYLGRKHAVAVSNDTAALELAMRLIDVRGKEVLIPANGIYSIITAIDRAGGIPVLMDIDIKNNINFTAGQVQEIINKPYSNVKAVVLMPCGGVTSPDSWNIKAVCEENGVYLIGDNAHAIGLEVRDDRGDGSKVGSFEDISCFSFYATKVMNTAEGGMILFDDDRWETEAKCMRNYGRTGDFGESIIVRDGYNWRMTEFHAALGCEQIQCLEVILANRRSAAVLYSKYWPDKLERIRFNNIEPNFYKYMAMLPVGIDKAEFKQRTEELGVTMSGDVYDVCIHKQPIYYGRWGMLSFPQAEEFAERHVCLPLSEVTTEEEVIRTVAVINEVLANLSLEKNVRKKLSKWS